jgi:hypothetical protein
MVLNQLPELRKALRWKDAGRAAGIIDECLSAWEGKGEPEA